MSNVCTTIKPDNYAMYDASFNKNNGKCMTGPNKTFVNSDGCLDNDFACYANYNLNAIRQNVDPKIADLYLAKGSMNQRSTNLNYEPTMLSGVIWAMLGTTVLYYAFTKM